MCFSCDPSVSGFPSMAGGSVSTFRLFSSVAGFLSVTPAVDSARAVFGISAVNGFSTFVLFSSIAGFPSVADLPAAVIAANLFLVFLHC